MDARWTDLWAPERRAATVTVALGVVLFAFNAFVVGTALPRAVAGFGGTRWLAWATSLYIICATVTGPAAALVIHRIGARAMFMASGAVFLLGTIMAAAAPGMVWLLAGRALQGIGAGFIESGCYVLIPRLFPPSLIPRVFGVEALSWAVAAFAGPALAGILAEVFSWRVALLSTLPMVLLFLALVPRVVPGREAVQDTAPRLPLLSLIGLALGMTLILISDGGQGVLWQVTLLTAGAAVFGLVIAGDGRFGARLLPRRGGLGLWLVFVMPLSQASGTVFLVFALQFLWGFSALQAGLSSTLLALSWSVAQMLTAQITVHRRRLIAVGAALLVLGQALLLLAFWQHNVAAMLAGQLVLGTAFGTSWGALSQAVMDEAGADRDVASGLLPVVMSLGYGVGAALYGLIANSLGIATAHGAALQGVMVSLLTVATLLALLSLGLALAMQRGGAAVKVNAG